MEGPENKTLRCWVQERCRYLIRRFYSVFSAPSTLVLGDPNFGVETRVSKWVKHCVPIDEILGSGKSRESISRKGYLHSMRGQARSEKGFPEVMSSKRSSGSHWVGFPGFGSLESSTSSTKPWNGSVVSKGLPVEIRRGLIDGSTSNMSSRS